MKIAIASVLSEAAPSLPRWKTMRKPSALLRKLSLNAEKNWHQNSGAKRRDIMRWFDMVCAFDWVDGMACGQPKGVAKQGHNEQRACWV